MAQRRITWDISKPESNPPLPFDQYFTLTLNELEVEDEDGSVRFVIYELSRSANSYLRNGSSSYLGAVNNLKSYCDTSLNVKAGSATVPILKKLSPNRDYFLVVEQKETLESTDMDDVEDALSQSLSLNERIKAGLVEEPKLGIKGNVNAPSELLKGQVEAFVADQVRIIASLGYSVDGDALKAITLKARLRAASTMDELNDKILDELKHLDQLEDGEQLSSNDVLNAQKRMLDEMKSAEGIMNGEITITSDSLQMDVRDGSVYERHADLSLATIGMIRVNQSLEGEIRSALVAATFRSLATSYDLDTKENAKFHYSLNFGGLYDFYGDKFRTFTTLNFFLRPIDHSLPLDAYDYSVCQAFLARTSVSIGLTDNSIADSGSGKRGLVGDRALILGAGFRLLSFATVNGGVLIYEQEDRNPLVTGYSTRFTPYIGLSANFELKDAFGLK